MGYAQVSQKGHGLHLRQYARAFIIDDNVKRVVFVSFDGAMIGHSVKRDVNQNFKSPTNLSEVKIVNILGCVEVGETVWKAIHS